MKKSKKFYAWKNKWRRKKRFNWLKLGAYEKYYRETKWCGDDIHKATRFQNKQAICKIINGQEDVNFPTKKPMPSRWAFLYW